MKLVINLYLFIFTLVILGNESFSLTDYQIKKICKKEKRQSSCAKNLQQRKANLQKGNIIEIPIIPYKGRN